MVLASNGMVAPERLDKMAVKIASVYAIPVVDQSQAQVQLSEQKLVATVASQGLQTAMGLMDKTA
jgi:hypothetical protein